MARDAFLRPSASLPSRPSGVSAVAYRGRRRIIFLQEILYVASQDSDI
jgi:hypothetical protein